MFVARALQKLTRAIIIVFYVALGGLIISFPIGYAGKVVIVAIQDSMPYMFVLAIVCAFLQMFDSFLSRRTGEGQGASEDTPGAASVD